MAILRNPKKESFTVVDNHALRDDNLSLKARGLLVTLISLPDNWHFSEDGLIEIFKNDGQASIRSGIKELEKFGYLSRERTRDEYGRMAKVVWTVSDNPRLENPSVVNSNLENRPQLNTNRLNTNRLSTDVCMGEAGEPAPPRQPEEPAIMHLILNDKSQYPITQSDVDLWESLYPAVDIMAELRKMAGWLDANPARRKTKAGIKRFVNSWLSREQDKGAKVKPKADEGVHWLE